MPIPYFSISIDTRAVNFKNTTDGIVPLVKIRLKYKNASKKFDIAMELFNTLDQTIVSINTIDPSFISTRSYPLVGRFMMVTLNYRIK